LQTASTLTGASTPHQALKAAGVAQFFSRQDVLATVSLLLTQSANLETKRLAEPQSVAALN
jgi:hypothetical protein